MITISVSKLIKGGSVASIQHHHEDIEISKLASDNNGQKVCRAAAKKLRELADAFESLATMDDRYQESTHKAAVRDAKSAQAS